jgi:epoxide hydrolase 4
LTIDPRISFSFADVDGVKLHYAKAGGGGKLVLLLHGFPEFWYSWRSQLTSLSDEYTIVAPDLRGYNLSDKPLGSNEYSVEKLVDDVAGLIRHLGHENAALIGHDWGAVITWAFAVERPELLWAVGALQVPPTPVWRRNQTFKQLAASWYMFFFQLPYIPELFLARNNFAALAEAIQMTTAKPGVITDDDIEMYRLAWRQPAALTAMLNYYRANILKRILGPSSPAKKVAVPTLFIYGEKDTAIVPSTAANVSELIDGPYTEHRIPDSGHWVQQEAAAEVTEVLRRFLASARMLSGG